MDMEIVQGSILEPADLDRLTSDMEVVIHTAAKISVAGDPDGTVHKTNVTGTQNVVNASLMNRVKRLVYFSSIHSMSPPEDGELFDEQRPSAEPKGGAYGLSKATAELELLKGKGQGLEVIILNPTAVIGPLDFRPSPTGQALIDLYNRKFPVLIQGGYDFVDVRDVAGAAVRAMDHGISGERYIVSGEYLDIKRMSELVEKYTGVTQPKTFLPGWIQWVGLPFVWLGSRFSGEPPMFTAEVIRTTAKGRNIDRSKAGAALDHRPRPIEEAIKDALEWFKTNGYLERK